MAIKIYIKEFSEQNFPEIDKEEFFNSYLSKYSKNKKKKTAYMMFVKEMHKEYEKKEQIDKIKFSEKAKLIGSKWCNLSDVEKEKYGFIADSNNMVEHDTDNDTCTWTNEKNNKKCFKNIYDNKYNLCKKHFKLFSKRKIFLERNKEKQNQIKSDDYINSEVQEILHDNSIIYYDIYKRIYSLDGQNNALCIGEIIDDNIILFDIKKESREKSHNESQEKSHNESQEKSHNESHDKN